jgi:hypothetical protein
VRDPAIEIQPTNSVLTGLPRKAIDEAKVRHDDNTSAIWNSVGQRIRAKRAHLSGGESKFYRMLELAKASIEERGDVDVEFLSLDRIASEYGRSIHPRAACFSTSPALCHWP